MSFKKSTLKKSTLAFATFAMAGMLVLPSVSQAQLVNAFKDPTPASSGSSAKVGPDLSAVTGAITGGQVSVGATAYVVALFRNAGTAPVNVTGINLYPSSTIKATVTLNKCAEAPLPPEAECAVTIAVSGIELGAWRVEMLLDHDGRTRLATTAITGEIVGTENAAEESVKLDVEARPEKVEFENATGGSTPVEAVLLRNRTSEAVDITEVKIDAADNAGFSFTSACPPKLEPAETCSVLVRWSPQAKGLAKGVLLINHSATSKVTQVPISGSFEPEATVSATLFPDTMPDRGLLIADKDKVDFGSGIKGASAITVSLVNAGAGDLTLNALRLAGSDNGLSIGRSGCRAGSVLKPVEACALTINWVPSREGAVIDDLQILHSGARGVLVLPVRGTADAAVSRESLAIRQLPQVFDDAGASAPKADPSADPASLPPPLSGVMEAMENNTIAPNLDGYTVTSLAATRGVINGPLGSLVVRDGEDVVISGVRWTVTITRTGIVLTSRNDEVLLVFDKSLRAKGISTGAGTTGSSSSTSSSSSSSTTTDTSSSTGSSTDN